MLFRHLIIYRIRQIESQIDLQKSHNLGNSPVTDNCGIRAKTILDGWNTTRGF